MLGLRLSPAALLAVERTQVWAFRRGPSPRRLCDAAQKAAERAARLAIENAKRSAGELAAAERAIDESAASPAAGKYRGAHQAALGETKRESPRFPIGARVECRLGEEKWAFGVVIGHFYREPSWPPDRRAPYQAMPKTVRGANSLSM